jgi:hypothetical protein
MLKRRGATDVVAMMPCVSERDEQDAITWAGNMISNKLRLLPSFSYAMLKRQISKTAKCIVSCQQPEKMHVDPV